MIKRIFGVIFALFLLAGTVFGVLLWNNRLQTQRLKAQEKTLQFFETKTVEAVKLNENRIAEKKAQEEIARAEEAARIAAEEAERKAAEEAAKTEKVAASVEQTLPVFDSLQGAVDYWIKNYYHGAVSIEIFDLNQNTVVASYNATVAMYPRSLYKLFYTYDAYTQIDAGLDDPNSLYLGNNTLSYCLDIMIRYSDNNCAEAMLNDPIRLTRVGQLIKALGLTSTQSDGLATSAHDISLLLQHYYAHPDWSSASWQKFLETALNQPYTYRKGLPSGFSSATVYNKVGFGGTTYNDAAIVEFPNVGKSYIIVVMTDSTSYANIATLGKLIEKTVLATH